jgi:hypothetical protein
VSQPTPNECTISGWLWYCDVHDTHGNADLKTEAETVSKAHEQFWAETDGCDIIIIQVSR